MVELPDRDFSSAASDSEYATKDSYTCIFGFLQEDSPTDKENSPPITEGVNDQGVVSVNLGDPVRNETDLSQYKVDSSNTGVQLWTKFDDSIDGNHPGIDYR